MVNIVGKKIPRLDLAPSDHHVYGPGRNTLERLDHFHHFPHSAGSLWDSTTGHWPSHYS